MNFSGFASLHRADLTHDTPEPTRSWARIAAIAVACVIAGALVCVLMNW